MNSVKLSGRLTRDPELKQTPAGVPVASFSLAVDRKFNRKGQRVIISEGRIRVTPFTDRDGNKRTRFEVVADEVEFGESKQAPEDREAGSAAADYMTSGAFEELGEEDTGDLPF